VGVKGKEQTWLISYVKSVAWLRRIPFSSVCIVNIIKQILVRKPAGKRPLGRPRYRWEDDIRRNLKEIGWKCVDWMHLGQDMYQWRSLVNTFMNFY
jgi:hypothetical protein